MKRLQEEMKERKQTAEQEYTLENQLLQAAPNMSVPTSQPGDSLDDSGANDAEDAKMAAMVDAEEAARKSDGAPKDEDPAEKRFFDDDLDRQHYISAEEEATRRGLYAGDPSSFVELHPHEPWQRPPSSTLSNLREKAAEQRRKAESAEEKLSDEADEDDPRLDDEDSSFLEAANDDGDEDVREAEQDVDRAGSRLAKAAEVEREQRQEQLRKDPELGAIAKRFDADQDEYESHPGSFLQAREIPALKPHRDDWRPSEDDLGRVHQNLHALHDYFSQVHKRFEADETTATAAPGSPATSFAQVVARYPRYHHRAGGEGKYVDTDTVPSLKQRVDPMGEMEEMRKEWKRDEAHFRAEKDEEDTSEEPPAIVQAEEDLGKAEEAEKEEDQRAREQNRMESVQEQPMAAEAEEHLASMLGKPPLPTDATDEIAELTRKPPVGWIGPSSLLDRGDTLAAESAAVQHGLAKLEERMRHAEDTIAAPGTESKLARLTAEKVGEKGAADPLAAMLAQGSGKSAKRALAMEGDAQKLLDSWAKKPHGTSLAELDPDAHRLALEREQEMQDQIDDDRMHLQGRVSKFRPSRERVLALGAKDSLGDDPSTHALGQITPLEYQVNHLLPKDLLQLKHTLDNLPYKTDPQWFSGDGLIPEKIGEAKAKEIEEERRHH